MVYTGFLTGIEHFDETMKGTYCVVTYDGKPYPGIVQDVDDTEVSFMFSFDVLMCLIPGYVASDVFIGTLQTFVCVLLTGCSIISSNMFSKIPHSLRLNKSCLRCICEIL